jgi:hypothetical protein
MANLTIAVDGALLKRARIRALELGTSVNAVLREHLEGFAAGIDSQRRTVRAVLKLSKGARSGSGRRRWTRDELHER